MPQPELAPYLDGFRFTGDIRAGTVSLLNARGLPHTAGHCARVAAEAGQIAARFGLESGPALDAGWLHDISAIVPDSKRIPLAEALGLEILPAESRLPMIIHQKLSAAIAAQAFQVTNPAILSAIACHTTLKAGASPMDMLVFVADKIAWDQPGKPPWLDSLLVALDQSLEHAAFCYTSYLWERRSDLPVVHPWFVAAHIDLAKRLGENVL